MTMFLSRLCILPLAWLHQALFWYPFCVQAEAGAAMEEQLRLSNARISELEAQVAGLDHAASPFTGRSPLLRSASKGLEATLRKRIETLEMELQSVGLMRSQEQVRGALPPSSHACLRSYVLVGGSRVTVACACSPASAAAKCMGLVLQ